MFLKMSIRERLRFAQHRKIFHTSWIPYMRIAGKFRRIPGKGWYAGTITSTMAS
jgi:hypothetical protein